MGTQFQQPQNNGTNDGPFEAVDEPWMDRLSSPGRRRKMVAATIGQRFLHGKIFDVTSRRERAAAQYQLAVQTGDNTDGAID